MMNFTELETSLLFYLISRVFIIVGLFDQAFGSNISITEANLDRKFSPGELIFQDEFDYLDVETWSHDKTLGGQNFDFQMNVNSRENSYVRNGTLFIKPTLTSDTYGEEVIFGGQLTIQGGQNDRCTNSLNFGCFRSGNYPHLINPVTSAKIYTMESFYFRYGRVVIRAKLPAGDWLWPSIRLQPRFNSYGPWPKSGFINILESRGNRDYVLRDKTDVNVGVGLVSSSVIFGAHPNRKGEMRFEKFAQTSGRGSFHEDFHVYEMEWTHEHIKFTIDGEPMGTVQPTEGGFWEVGHFGQSDFNPWLCSHDGRMAPFDQKFYLALHVSVGGTVGYFVDHWFLNTKAPKPWHNDDKISSPLRFYEAMNDWYPTWRGEDSALQVDYIRVYAV